MTSSLPSPLVAALAFAAALGDLARKDLEAGNLERAAALADERVSQARTLAQDWPGEPAALAELAAATRDAAGLALLAEDRAAVKLLYAEHLAALRRLAQQDAQLAERLAAGLVEASEVAQALGDRVWLAELAGERLTLAASPLERARALGLRAALLAESGDSAAAWAAYSNALDLLRGLVTQQPNDGALRLEMALTLWGAQQLLADAALRRQYLHAAQLLLTPLAGEAAVAQLRGLIESALGALSATG